MSYLENTLLPENSRLSHSNNFSPEQLNARRKIDLLKNLAMREDDSEISIEFRRTANKIYRKYFGYNRAKVKANIVRNLNIELNRGGLTAKELAEDLSVDRKEIHESVKELMKENILTLYHADQPHQLGKHQIHIFILKS